jgi:hypothetical protein
MKFCSVFRQGGVNGVTPFAVAVTLKAWGILPAAALCSLPQSETINRDRITGTE